MSAEALEVARANAARLQLDGRVKLAQSDVLTPVQNAGVTRASRRPLNLTQVSSRAKRKRGPAGRRFCAWWGVGAESRDPYLGRNLLRDFDFVVSNPPYVGFDEADKVQKSVREFEPQVAVFAGEQGLDVIGPLIAQAHQALKPGGWLAMEIGYSMRDAVVNLLGSHNVGGRARRARSAGNSKSGGGKETMTAE